MKDTSLADLCIIAITLLVLSSPTSSAQEKPLPVPPPNTGDFTVREYRIYRDVIGTPMSVPEAQTLDNVAQKYKLTVR